MFDSIRGSFRAVLPESNSSGRLYDFFRSQEDYKVSQINGQRIFELREHCGPAEEPPQGCEIFVGNIPKQVYENCLIPLFQKIGRIYKFRLMLDYNSHHRGFAFVQYFTPDHVQQAIERWNGFPISPGVLLAVSRSLDNRRLFVGNLPREVNGNDVRNVFDNYVSGVVNVIIYPSWNSKNQNRGFAFVEFQSHNHASVARRQLHPRNLVAWEQELYVDWAEPIPDVDPSIMAQVTVLIVKNLPPEWTNEKCVKLIYKIGGGSFIQRVHRILTYAFVHCRNRACAEIVMDNFKDASVKGEPLTAEWARPPQYSTANRDNLPPDHLCL